MLLALLVAVSVCVAGTVAAEEETRDLAFKTWGPQELNQAGEAVGTKNSHNYPVYTYFYDVIGRRSKSAADLFIANATIPHEFNGERSIYNGKEYMIYVRLMASDNYEIGNLCLMDLLYGVEEYGT